MGGRMWVLSAVYVCVGMWAHAQGTGGTERELGVVLTNAESEWKRGDLEKAEWSYRKGLTLALAEPQRVEVLIRLAMLQMVMQRADKGMVTYEEIYEKHPAHTFAPNAMLVRANYAVLEKDQLFQGIKLYEALIERYPASDAAKKAGEWMPELKKMTTSDLKLANDKRRRREAAEAKREEILQRRNEARQKKGEDGGAGSGAMQKD